MPWLTPVPAAARHKSEKPDQQILPADPTALITAEFSAWDSGRAENAKSLLNRALILAQQTNLS